MDLLGLRTLTVIGDAIKFIYETTGDKLDIDKIPLDDEATCSMLRKGDTQGEFQLESGGMTKLVMDLGPESFEDLIPLVALYRPGPLGTGMVEDFIAGRHGEKTAEMLHPLLEPVLKDTFGVILYPEHAVRLCAGGPYGAGHRRPGIHCRKHGFQPVRQQGILPRRPSEL